MRKKKAIRELGSISERVSSDNRKVPTWEILYHSLQMDGSFEALGYRKRKSTAGKMEYVMSPKVLGPAESFRKSATCFFLDGQQPVPKGWEREFVEIGSSILEGNDGELRAQRLERVIGKISEVCFSILVSKRKRKFAFCSLLLASAFEAIGLPSPIFHTDESKQLKRALGDYREFEKILIRNSLSGAHKALAKELGKGFLSIPEIKELKNTKDIYVREGWSWKEFGEKKSYTWLDPEFVENLLTDQATKKRAQN